jgi:uncharacterized membrane protein YccC
VPKSQEEEDVHLWFSGLSRSALEHAARTTVAATASFAIAAAFRLPEAHWAAISTIVVTQSTLGTALTVSGQRFVGTAMGAAAGAVLAGRLGSSMAAFAAGLLGLGVVCALLGLDRAAYRFAGITLAIIVLVPPVEIAWRIALHRFVEVSVGIAVGLAAAKLWPEREPAGRV